MKTPRKGEHTTYAAIGTPSTYLQQYSHPRDTKTSAHTGHGAPGGVKAAMESSHTAPAQKHIHGANQGSSQQQGRFKLKNVSNNMLRDCQCSCVWLRRKTQPVLSRSFSSGIEVFTPVLLARPTTKSVSDGCPSACPKPQWHSQVQTVAVFPLMESLCM